MVNLRLEPPHTKLIPYKVYCIPNLLIHSNSRIRGVNHVRAYQNHRLY